MLPTELEWWKFIAALMRFFPGYQLCGVTFGTVEAWVLAGAGLEIC